MRDLISIQSKLAEAIYDSLYCIDKRLGWIEPYSYEDAPYCGHHKSGHNGKLTESRYHEGMGGSGHSNWLFAVEVSSEQDPNTITLLPTVQSWIFWAKRYAPVAMACIKTIRLKKWGAGIRITGLKPAFNGLTFVPKIIDRGIFKVGDVWIISKEGNMSRVFTSKGEKK